jgi:hypothetical protein
LKRRRKRGTIVLNLFVKRKKREDEKGSVPFFSPSYFLIRSESSKKRKKRISGSLRFYKGVG